MDSTLKEISLSADSQKKILIVLLILIFDRLRKNTTKRLSILLSAETVFFSRLSYPTLYIINMSCILHIETSTQVCSVALSQDGACLFEKTDMKGPSHAQVLAGYISEAISFADSHAIPLDAVAVSKGPGSYTGLRIGVSEAKGIAYGRNAKLLSVSTLKLLTVPILLGHDEIPDDALLCPMIDARRMEVYCALYDRALNEIQPVQALIIDADSFKDVLEQHPIYFIGNGADKCAETIQHPNAHFIPNIHPLAKNMVPLAEMAIARHEFEDVAYFEPFYLKEFVTTQSKKTLL